MFVQHALVLTFRMKLTGKKVHALGAGILADFLISQSIHRDITHVKCNLPGGDRG
jgi:hypothetical protein